MKDNACGKKTALQICVYIINYRLCADFCVAGRKNGELNLNPMHYTYKRMFKLGCRLQLETVLLVYIY